MKFTKDGFTLPELLLSVAILAFAITGVLLLFINCTLLNDANRNLSVVTSHAQFVLEDIKNTAFSTLQTNINAGSWDWNAAAINTNGLTALNNEVIDTSATGTEPLDVTVTVTWQDRGQRNRTFTLETLITDS